MELDFKPLTAIRLDPLAINALVLLFGPAILELVQLETLVFETGDVRPDALSVMRLPILKGVTDRIRNQRDSILWRTVTFFNSVAHLLFDAVAAFLSVVEADQVAVWILAFYGAQRGRDLLSFSFGD